MCYEFWSDRQLSNLSPSFPLETGKNFVSTLRLAFQVMEGLTHHLGCLVDDLLFLPPQDTKIVYSKFSAVPLDALLMKVVEKTGDRYCPRYKSRIKNFST